LHRRHGIFDLHRRHGIFDFLLTIGSPDAIRAESITRGASAPSMRAVGGDGDLLAVPGS